MSRERDIYSMIDKENSGRDQKLSVLCFGKCSQLQYSEQGQKD